MKLLTIGIAAHLLTAAPIILQAMPIQGPHTYGVVSWKQSQAFHAACLTESKLLGLNEDSAYFHMKLAAVDIDLNRYANALNHVNDALTLYKSFDQDTQTRLHLIDACVLKGKILGCLGDHTQAIAEMLQFFAENISIRGQEDLQTARIYNDLGWQFEMAAKTGISPNNTILQKSNLDSFIAYLGTLNFTPDESCPLFLSLAQECFAMALSIDQKTVGEIHPDTAKSYNLIGEFLTNQGKYAEALPLHQNALTIQLACQLVTTPETAKCYSHIGWCYEHLHDLSSALQNYHTALDIMRQVLPQSDPTLEQTKERVKRVSRVLEGMTTSLSDD